VQSAGEIVQTLHPAETPGGRFEVELPIAHQPTAISRVFILPSVPINRAMAEVAKLKNHRLDSAPSTFYPFPAPQPS
jgi:hypothetical protein